MRAPHVRGEDEQQEAVAPSVERRATVSQNTFMIIKPI